jgi:hypothetical protein
MTLTSLAQHPVWVGWKKEARNGQLSPYDPITGRPASTNDTATWATHEHADG